MKDLENKDYLDIIKSTCTEITEIRKDDDTIVLESELENIVLNADADSFSINEWRNDKQQYCIACTYKNRLVAVDVKNISNDRQYFESAFWGEIYNFEQLVLLLEKENVIPRGIIVNGYRHSFKSDSSFDVNDEIIEVTDNSYPYKIYKNNFVYFRDDYDYESFGACDRCIYLYYKDGTCAKICFDVSGS